MGIIKPQTSYSLLGMVWTVLVVGSVAAIYTGNAEPYVAASTLPASKPVTGGAAAAVLLVGWLLVTTRLAGLWKEAGRSAGLEPGSGSLLSGVGIGSKPELTGTVDGRPVRVHTESRKTGNSGSEGGSKYTTYTVVETELAEPAEAGVAIVRRTPGGSDREDVSFGNVNFRAVSLDDDFASIGEASGLAEALVTGPARTPLRALDPGTMVIAGDAVDTLLDAVPEMQQSSFFGGMATDALREGLPSEPGTVAVQTKGTTLDADALRRRAEGVVAAADEFEAVSGIGE